MPQGIFVCWSPEGQDLVAADTDSLSGNVEEAFHLNVALHAWYHLAVQLQEYLHRHLVFIRETPAAS